MKYAAFFLCLTMAALYYLQTSSALVTWLLIYLAINCTIMAIAYFFNRPTLVMGKTRAGQINLFLLLINLPWLLLTWLIWLCEVIISQEDKINRIGLSNIYLGRYPCFSKTEGFDLVIDLTAEFLPWKAVAKDYICFPNLDGIQLRNTPLNSASPSNTNPLPWLSPNQKILIHCAQGHGRSATFAALLLHQLSPGILPQEALAIILKSRPAAKPSQVQLRQIHRHSTTGLSTLI